jgi:CHAT domain-containing protein
MLGDGESVTLDRIMALARPGVKGPDLAALTGCETFPERFGADGSEVDMLGWIFQGMGVPSLLASLWRSDGLSTTALMREFYRLRFAEGLGKAEALQGAQKAFLRSASEGDPAEADAGDAASGTDVSRAAAPAYGTGWSHPYYWASVILMGDWR